MVLLILMGSFEAILVWFLTYDPFALGGPTWVKRATTWGEGVELTLILNLSDYKKANSPLIFFGLNFQFSEETNISKYLI